MSADNFLLIKKVKRGFELTHRDASSGGKLFGTWPIFKTLEEAVKAANKFSDKEEIEYGLEVKI